MSKNKITYQGEPSGAVKVYSNKQLIGKILPIMGEFRYKPINSKELGAPQSSIAAVKRMLER